MPATKDITKEQALDSLAEERRLEMQRDAEQRAVDEQHEADRQATLKDARERAQAVVKARGVLVPELVAALEVVRKVVGELRIGKANFNAAHTHAVRAGGTLDTVYPRAFGIDHAERALLRDAVECIQSVGWTV